MRTEAPIDPHGQARGARAVVCAVGVIEHVDGVAVYRQRRSPKPGELTRRKQRLDDERRPCALRARGSAVTEIHVHAGNTREHEVRE